MTFKDRFQNAVQAFFSPGVVKTGAWERAWLRGIESTIAGDKLTEPYRQYEWVYIAIREIAVAISQIPFKYFRGEAEVESHNIITLFDRPNPHSSCYQFKEAIMTLLLLEGNVFVVPWSTQGTNMPDQLWVFDRSAFRALYDEITGQVRAWEFQDRTKRLFAPDEIAHIKLINPYDRIWGMSPLTAARLSTEADYSALTYQKALMDNHAEPAGIITIDAPITEHQIKALRQQWEERHKGTKQAGKIAVLQKGMDYKSITIPQKDMQFLETRRYNRESILACYQVPKGVIGITDDLNYATLWGQKKIFWQDTVLPYVTMLEDSFNTQILKKYAPDIIIAFDLSNVAELHEDFTEKVKNAQILASMGFTINSINQKLELGFDPLPWGDMHFVPMSMIPIDMAGMILPTDQNSAGKTGPKALPAIKAAPDNGKVKYHHWVKFLTVHDPLERKFRSKMQRFFFEQRNIILDLLLRNTKQASDVTAYVWIEQDNKLKEMVRPLYRDAAYKGSQLVANMLDAESFTITNPLIDMKVEWRANQITRIDDKIRELIRIQLDEGMKRGESIAALSDRVKKVYFMAKARANTIARTEIAGAMNDGEFLMMEHEGVEKKEWLSARDNEVRASHQAEDGNVVALDEPFPVTGLFYPNDPYGPAEEVINCRCSLLPVIE